VTSTKNRLPWQRFGFGTWIYLLQKRRRNRKRGCQAAKAEFCAMSLCATCKPQLQEMARRARGTD